MTKHKIKNVVRPGQYLVWHFHYSRAGIIAISERLLIEKKLNDENRIPASGTYTPNAHGYEYHAPTEHDALKTLQTTKI